MIRRRALRLIAATIAVAALITGALAVGPAPSAPASAADAAQFDPGYIMSDSVFYNSQAFSASQLQSFIASKGANCTDNGSNPCLKNLSITTPSIAANQYCSAISAASSANAGTIFATVGNACGINPAVLVTLVEKEQGLVSTTSPSGWMYQAAAGFACPDTAPCDANYSGFLSQVYAGARQFQIYRQNPGSFNYQAGRVNSIQLNPNANCGTQAVYIENQATAGLYDYTPYVPNAAALSNLYGTGDSCSSYGNRNFWRVYSDWFGDPHAGDIKCPNFENCVTGWGFGGSIDRANYAGSAAEDGSGFLSVTPHDSSASLYQDITRNTLVGDSFQVSIWVRAASSGATTKGRFVLWGLGGSGNEPVVDSFSVGSTWTELKLNFTQQMASHPAVRIQVYFDSPNVETYLDNVQFTPQPVQPARTPAQMVSPSFESGPGAWGYSNGFVNQQIYSNGAEDGTHYFATNTDVLGHSLSQDVPWPVSRTTAYTATIWLRSASGVPYSGTLALWGLGGAAAIQGVTPFTVGPQWTQVSVTLPVTRSDENDLRLEVYEQTRAPATLDLDNAAITANLLQDGSVERPAGWSPHESGTNFQVYSAAQVSSPGPVDGSRLGATNTSVDNGSIQNVVSRNLTAGETYTASIWIRSAYPGTTFTGALALSALGPDGNSSASVPVSVGTTWTKFAVTLTVTHSSSNELLMQLNESAGQTAYFDGAVLH